MPNNLYTTGTISITADSTMCTGSGTAWSSAEIQPGDEIHVAGEPAIAIVKTVDSETQITTELPWAGATVSAGDYAIFRTSYKYSDVGQSSTFTLAMLAQIRDASIFYAVSGAAPDPSLGEDNHYAVKTNVTPWIWWVKSGGAWIETQSPFPVQVEGTYAGGTTYASGDLVTYDGSVWRSLQNSNVGHQPDVSPTWWELFIGKGDPGADGYDGWSPVLAVATDGARRVLQVADWQGGEGTEPATGKYVGVSGLVDAIGDGVDIRGATGAIGVDGASALTVVRVVATSNIAIATALESGDTIDGVTLDASDLVLLTAQTAPAENGVYVASASGAAVRHASFDTYDEHPGRYFSVQEGTMKADTLWRCTSNRGGTLGTTAITIGEFATGGAQGGDIINGHLVYSVASNALTVALKTDAGTDPSVGNPVYVRMRDAAAGTDSALLRTITSALSLTISSGSTLGTLANIPFALWAVLFDDGGTFRLGVINCLASTHNSIYPLAGYSIASSTADGGTGAADSEWTFYTGAAVASKPYTLLGRAEWGSGLATPGTWSSGPTRVDMMGKLRLPGSNVVTIEYRDTAYAAHTGDIPFDDTIPQNTEGSQVIALGINPVSAANLLMIEALLQFTHSSVVIITAAMFRDDFGANAIAAGWQTTDIANFVRQIVFNHTVRAVTTSTVTFKIRMGGNSGGGTLYFNGQSGARKYGGALASMIRIREIMV